MTKSTLLFTIALLLPRIVFANDEPELSDEDMKHVVSAVITLKTNCVANKLADCKAADAVMKMFRRSVMEVDSEQKDYYMKKYGSLFLESMTDAVIEAKANDAKPYVLDGK